jgi:hypothetical protein
MALWRRVEGWGEVCVGRVCFNFLTRGGAIAADCVHGGLAYIGVSVGGTDHGALTRTPRKTERAYIGNRHCACVEKTDRSAPALGIGASSRWAPG